jgi:prepilin-type N-terminal cleavage/methylation domain-containing protein
MRVLNAVQSIPASGLRRGVTLTEVLMSLMIMAIGVTSVMTLFPIATLRSAQATRLTNSALLKYNVEALLDARPELIFNPDGDSGPNALTEHFRGADRNYIVDPLGYFSAFEYGGGGTTGREFAQRMGNDGSVPLLAGIRRFDGGILSRAGVDPDLFGNAAITNDELRALRILGAKESQLGDTWDTQFDFFIEDYTTDLIRDANNEVVAIRIPEDVIPDADALSLVQTSATEIPSTVPIADPEVHRITLFSADGQLSQTYPLLLVNAAREATWSESIAGVDRNGDGHIENRPIPREFQGTIGRVLIQSKRAADFTWMLSVRRAADGQARNVDVIVRFGERLKLEDEYLYPYLSVIAPVPPVPGPAVAGRNFAGTSVVFCSLDGREPALKRGGYMFDVANALWYRIREYEIDEDAGAFSVMLEKPASKAFTGGAIFLPGIIDVYPMGSRNLP